MKSRQVIAVLAVVVIAACVVFLWRDGAAALPLAASGEPAAPRAPQSAPLATVAASRGSSKPVAKKGPAVMLGDLVSGELFARQPSAAEVQKFLAKEGETAANLVAAFEATDDPKLLERAEALYPNSPLVLLALVGRGQPPEKMAAWLDRLKAADPKNPLPWIYSAQQLIQEKNPTAALDEVRTALSLPGFYTYANERMAAAKALFLSAGSSPLEAEVKSMFGLRLPQMSAAHATGRGLMELHQSMVQEGNAAADEALQMTYQLGKMFATPEASRFLIGQLVGISLEARALQVMPAETPLPNGTTAQQRLEEIQREKVERTALLKKSEAVMQGDADFAAEYLRHVKQDGELSAMRWLDRQK